MKAEQLLPETLALAVPLWIDEIRDWPPHARRGRAVECSIRLHEQGQLGVELHWNCGKPGETASAFNALALAIACCAYQPGGIRAFGMLWCAEHPGAPASTEGGQICSGCAPVLVLPEPESGTDEVAVIVQHDGCDCDCHGVIQPGLVPCPACAPEAELR